MKLKRIAADLLAIGNKMDELIETHAGSRNPIRLWRLSRELLALKRRKDELVEQV